MSSLQIEMKNVFKSFPVGANELSVIKGINFQLHSGDSVGIIGASGSGKSTFLHLLGGLESVTSGQILFHGQDWQTLTEEEKSQYRNTKVGYVFQFHHLINEFSIIENVMLPCRIAGFSKKQAQEESEKLLTYLKLQDRMNHYPSQISGGELQRASIARAIVRRPEILLADEPTGSLDSKTSVVIQDLLLNLQSEFRMSLVVVTHDLSFASRFARSLKLSDGQWVGNSF